jgi:hypothetical protein
VLPNAEDKLSAEAAKFPTGFNSLKRFKEGEIVDASVGGLVEAGPSLRLMLCITASSCF